MTEYFTALLPIKANSERVEGKNFRLLAGKPLFAWILESLLAAPSIEQIIINTDAEEILNRFAIIRNEKVLLKPRKPVLCGHHVSMNLIIEDDIRTSNAKNFLMTHATNPFISTNTIQNAISSLENSPQNDSLFSVNKVQTRFYDKQGKAINHDPNDLIRTQDLEPYFEENSCLYLFSARSFASSRARIGETPLMFATPPEESLDIDEQYEWDIASALAESRRGSR